MNKAPDRSRPPVVPPPDDEDATDLPYVVEAGPAGDPEAVVVLARLHSLSVARATYEAAVAERPGALVVLRQGNRVLCRGGLARPCDDG